jgi:hypothetical protein
MRVMVKFRSRVESAQARSRKGELADVLDQILTGVQTEVVHSYVEAGQQAGHFVFDMRDPSEMTLIAERFFAGMNATVEMIAVPSAEGRCTIAAPNG